MKDETKYLRAEPALAGSDDIPDFLHFPPVEEPTITAQLARLNQLAESDGWRAALAATYADPGFVRYVTDTQRASFIDLLPIDANTDVLEIGPGLGQFTAVLAARAKSVHALEVVPGQARFTLTRSRQQDFANVSVAVGGDACDLPYRDASFDVVVLNLVFEWCASRLATEPHEVAQMRLLREMQRVLRPGGTLYLATKNRYALRVLLGGEDEHLHGLRFGSALPRALAATLMKRQGHDRAAGQLYSHDALAAMLGQAGFGSVRSYWAAPDMRYPTQYVPTDAASVRAARANPAFVQSAGRVKGLLTRLTPAGWVRHITPGLAFVARKAAGR